MTLGQNLSRFTRICETLGEDSLDLGRGFAGICETLGEDLWGFPSIHGDLQGFTRLWERIRQDSQAFTRLWDRIHETLEEDL